MTPDELIEGSQWLVRELYSKKNLTSRIRKFFEKHEESPNKNEFRIPVQRLDREGLIIVVRIIVKLLLKGEREDLRMLWELVKFLRTSSLPQKYDILIGSYLTLKNSQVILKRANRSYQLLNAPSVEEAARITNHNMF